MAIETRPGLSGFVASDPEQTTTVDGKTRLYFLAGQEKVRFEEDGSRTKLDSEFVPLVMFGPSAELAAPKFRKGDNFLAEGKLEPYTTTVDGKPVERESFRASRIGHDNNVTRYTVDRSPRERAGAERDAPARDAAGQDPLQAVLDQREQQLAAEPAAKAPAASGRKTVAR